MLLALLLSRPALAELTPAIERIGQPDNGLPDGEVMAVALAAVTVSIKLGMGWYIRREAQIGPPPDDVLADPDARGLFRALAVVGLAPAGLARSGVVGLSPRRSASEAFATRTPLARLPGDRDQPDAAELIERWRPDFSEPAFLDLAEALYRQLLPRRLAPDLGPFEALVRPGARETLVGRAPAEQVTAITAVHTGPARLVRASADETWISADVELSAVVVEQTPAGTRARLRVDLLRLQTRTESPAAAPEAWRTALEAADEDLVLPQELGGWVLASVLRDRVGPVDVARLRQVDGPDSNPTGRPGRSPAVDLPADLRAFEGRHPEEDLASLCQQVRALATRSLSSRVPSPRGDELPQPAPDEQLATWTTPRIQHLHDFWRAAARWWDPPPLALSAADRFVAAQAHVTSVHPLRITLDGRLERVDLAVTVARSHQDGDDVHHVEVWRLGRAVGTPDPWRVVDLRWAPAPIG